MNTHRNATCRRGFTMLEILVVAALFVLVLAIGVPAFSGMLRSTEQSMAENAMRIGIASARDAAVRSPRGEDAAAVFFYEPGVGYTIVSYQYAGVLFDATSTVGSSVPREVFVPVPGYEPVHLPGGWMIRGFAPPFSIGDGWYSNNNAQPIDPNPYNSLQVQRRGNWVFPETGFYNVTLANEGRKRRTFMLRFEGGTGSFKVADPREVLLLAPSPSQSFRNQGVWRDHRADRVLDGRRFVRRVLALPPGSVGDMQQLLGDGATDTVLAKPVALLALYEERSLIGGLGAAGLPAAQATRVRLNRDTGSMYLWLDRPSFVPTGVNGNDLTEVICAWIEDRHRTTTEPIDSTSRIFTIHRYLGTVQEVTGSMAVGATP
jgi:prepilin-type N-terminal cleavage/methylation domain-containing protein